jgi:hypothetical protein
VVAANIMKGKILFITGSLNQTSQMHQIAQQLPDYDCWFSQFFTDWAFPNALIKYTGLLDNTIAAGQFKFKSEAYLTNNNLQIDYRGLKNRYDLVVFCTDLHVPKRFNNTKKVFVQEGMTDKYTLVSIIVKKLNLPAALTGDTSLNGSTNMCDVYCVASEGYKRHFSSLGTNPGKIIVTGMPNYDNVKQHQENDFPYRDYVMVATTDMRETFRKEDRPAFIKESVKIAKGRKMLFKLHPNENFKRAAAEINEYAPKGSLVYQAGNTNQMIANCAELITQYSTVVYVGMALGKKVHSYFNMETLKRLQPVQNGGMSAFNIAQVCRNYVEFNVIRPVEPNPYYELTGLLKGLDMADNV